MLRNIFAANYVIDSHAGHLEIRCHRDVIDIPHIQLKLLCPPNCVAAIHLSPTRNTWLYTVATSLLSIVERKVLHEQRPRANEAHISLENVDKLWQLVNGGGANETANRGKALAIRPQISLCITAVVHGFELDDLEDSLIHARAFLRKEDVAAIGNRQQQHRAQNDWRKQHQQQKGSAEITQGFEKSHVHQFLIEAGADDGDDARLLFGRHLVVGGQAEAAVEDVHAHVQRQAILPHAATGDVGVGSGAAIALAGDEGVHAVDGLHVHGLTDLAPLGVAFCESFQNLGGAALAGLGRVERFAFTAHLAAHGRRVNQQAAEPEVGLALRRVIRVQAHGQPGQPFAVALVDGFFLRDVFLKVRHLPACHAGNDVAHAVVVAKLFVLIPGGVFAALGGPLAGFLGIFPAVGEQHAAAGAGDDLVAVEAGDAHAAEAPRLHALIGGAEGFSGVFHNHRPVLVADGADLIHLRRGAVEVHNDDHLHLGVDLEGFFQRHRIHVPGVALRVDEDGDAALVHHGVDGGVKGHV